MITAVPQGEIAGEIEILSTVMPALRNEQAPAGERARASKEEVFVALRQLLKAMCKSAPVVLCIEDLQWADSGTIQFFNFIARETRELRIITLGTFRSDEVDGLSPIFDTIGEGRSTRLELPPLDEEDIAELVHAMLGHQLDDHFTQELHKSTQGNPFFVVETLRSFIEEGHLELRQSAWSIVTPIGELPFSDSLAAIVRRRLEQMSPDLKQLCRYMAALGRLIDLKIVHRAVDLEETELFRRIDALLERQFIVKVEDSLLFSHDRIWEYTYEATPDPERAQLHRDIADAILQIPEEEISDRDIALARHFELAGAPRQAYRYYRKAADTAIADHHLLQATIYFEKALHNLELADIANKDHIMPQIWAQIVQVSEIANPRLCAIYSDKIIDFWKRRFDVVQEANRFQANSQRILTRRGFFAQRRLRHMWDDKDLDVHTSKPQTLIPAIISYLGVQTLAYTSSGEDGKAQEVLDLMRNMTAEPSILQATTLNYQAINQVHVAQWKRMLDSCEIARTWFDDHLKYIGFIPKRFHISHLLTYYCHAFAQASMGMPLDLAAWNYGLEKASSYNLPEWVMTFYLPRLIRGVMTGTPKTFTDAYSTLNDLLNNLGKPLMIASRLDIFAGFYWLQRKDKKRSQAVIKRLERWSRRLPHDIWVRRYLKTYQALYAYHWHKPLEAETALDQAIATTSATDGFRHRIALLCSKIALAKRRGDLITAHRILEEALAYVHAPETSSPWDLCAVLRTQGEILGDRRGLGLLERARALADDNGQAVQSALVVFAQGRVYQDISPEVANSLFDEAREQFLHLQCGELVEDVDNARAMVANGPLSEDVAK